MSGLPWIICQRSTSQKKDFGILQLNYNDLFKHILFASSLLETQELPLQQNITVNLG